MKDILTLLVEMLNCSANCVHTPNMDFSKAYLMKRISNEYTKKYRLKQIITAYESNLSTHAAPSEVLDF